MRILVILVLILAAGFYVWKRERGDPNTPLVIVNPVYAAVHTVGEGRGRSLDFAIFAKAVDAADCKLVLGKMNETMTSVIGAQSKVPWQIKSSECTADLPPRHVDLFSNKPGFVSYVSITPASRAEREVRMIVWGVTAEESELVCTFSSKAKENFKGQIQCIHALPA